MQKPSKQTSLFRYFPSQQQYNQGVEVPSDVSSDDDAVPEDTQNVYLSSNLLTGRNLQLPDIEIKTKGYQNIEASNAKFIAD